MTRAPVVPKDRYENRDRKGRRRTLIVIEWIGDRKAKLQFSRPEILCSFLFALVHIS